MQFRELVSDAGEHGREAFDGDDVNPDWWLSGSRQGDGLRSRVDGDRGVLVWVLGFIRQQEQEQEQHRLKWSVSQSVTQSDSRSLPLPP